MGMILVVDDSPLACAMLRNWLSEAGYEVITAHNADEAFTALAGRTPSLILLDIMMPGDSGIEICRRLKQADATSPIPVIMLTSAPSPANRAACLELGAAAFLAKPIVQNDLLTRVRALLTQEA